MEPFFLGRPLQSVLNTWCIEVFAGTTAVPRTISQNYSCALKVFVSIRACPEVFVRTTSGDGLFAVASLRHCG